ncbi:hypothetical protein [Absidia glauca]|uniref:peptidylprolyl isomerase n=1 Tax=Absidia glauca TaxID=4829 RepID=A0A168SX27_ABSGL|nr:hypothetical protein [Absidia glauca]
MYSILLKPLLSTLAVLCVFSISVQAIDDGPPPTGNVLGRTLHQPIKCDKRVATNARIKLHYTARQWNSEEFYENTYDKGEPLSYKLGSDKLMKGLEQGIKDMCEHESRRLLIPADLAFGEIGLPGLVDRKFFKAESAYFGHYYRISDTAIIMDVELLEVNSPFRNPWFWAGLIALVGSYIMIQRQAKLEKQAKAAAFIERKEQ